MRVARVIYELDEKHLARVVRVLHLGGGSEKKYHHPRGGTNGVVCNVCCIPVCAPDLMRCRYHAPVTTDTLESFMNPAAAAYMGKSKAEPPPR